MMYRSPTPISMQFMPISPRPPIGKTRSGGPWPVGGPGNFLDEASQHMCSSELADVRRQLRRQSCASTYLSLTCGLRNAVPRWFWPSLRRKVDRRRWRPPLPVPALFPFCCGGAASAEGPPGATAAKPHAAWCKRCMYMNWTKASAAHAHSLECPAAVRCGSGCLSLCCTHQTGTTAAATSSAAFSVFVDPR